MIKITEVKIRIESTIDNLDESGLPIGDPERSVSEAEGFLRYEDGDATLTYREENEGGKADSEIICSGGRVTVVRHGDIESEMVFEQGARHSFIYSLPPYKFDAEIITKRVRAELNPDGGRIDLLYNMQIGGAQKATRMKIWISPSSNQI